MSHNKSPLLIQIHQVRTKEDVFFEQKQKIDGSVGLRTKMFRAEYKQLLSRVSDKLRRKLFSG